MVSEIRINRLRELAKAVTQGREAVLREFTMRVPAEPDRDADLVISWAAEHIKNLEECSMLKAYWELQGRIKELESLLTEHVYVPHNRKIAARESLSRRSRAALQEDKESLTVSVRGESRDVNEFNGEDKE